MDDIMLTANENTKPTQIIGYSMRTLLDPKQMANISLNS